MPTIRNKSLQSRRIGSALNGMGFFDQTDWTGDYEYIPADQNEDWYSGGNTTQMPNVNILDSFLNFGAKFMNPQPTQQPIQYTGAPAQPARSFNTPLLIAAALAAVAVVAWPKSRR